MMNLILHAFLLISIWPQQGISDISPERQFERDSVVIAKISKVVTIDSLHRLAQVSFQNLATSSLKLDKKYILSLRGLRLIKFPEGVYEVYISPDKETKLDPESASFTSVINTFGLVKNSDANKAEFNVTKHIRRLASTHMHTSDLHVSILYRGNLNADKRESRNAGKLVIGEMWLIELG